MPGHFNDPKITAAYLDGISACFINNICFAYKNRQNLDAEVALPIQRMKENSKGDKKLYADALLYSIALLENQIYHTQLILNAIFKKNDDPVTDEEMENLSKFLEGIAEETIEKTIDHYLKMYSPLGIDNRIFEMEGHLYGVHINSMVWKQIFHISLTTDSIFGALKMSEPGPTVQVITKMAEELTNTLMNDWEWVENQKAG